MRKLCDSVDRFCLQHPRFGIPNLMKFLVGIMAVVFVLDLFSNGYASYMLYFNAELVLQGELWRLVTWMFLPTNGSLFWIFISLSFYYFIGTSIEEYWGTAKFTLFYLACAVLMVVFGMSSILWSPLPVVSSGNLNQILFLAFATLYPDALIRVYLILPVKAKWLAALYVLLTLYDLLCGLMLQSGNDAGIAIAEHVAGSEEAFVQMMNEEALKLGATGTHFANPHGLQDANHYTTAYDLYLMFNAAVQNDTFREIIELTTYSAAITGADGAQRTEEWKPTNFYAVGDAQAPEGVKVLGGKTGTTDEAGSCLILYSEDLENHPYISIVMGADDKPILYDEMTALLAVGVAN